MQVGGSHDEQLHRLSTSLGGWISPCFAWATSGLSRGHLSADYPGSLCRLGARLKRLALDKLEAIHRFSMPG